MKKSGAKTKGKGLDFKQLALEHGEKAVLGVVALTVLLILGVGTHWASYKATTPEELDEKLTTAAATIAAGEWPEEKREEYARHSDGRALREKVNQLMTGIDVSQWMYGPMTFPLYRTQEPIQEPGLVRISDLVADWGTALIEKLPENGGFGPDGMPLAAADGIGLEDYEDPDGLGVGPGGRRPEIDSDIAPVRNQRGAGLGFDDDGEYAPPGGVGRTTGLPGGAGLPGGPGDYGMDDEYGGGYGMTQKINAEGLRYVSVRGLYPVLEQVKLFAKALHIEDESRAYEFIELHDFILERQTAQAGDDPWSGPWEKMELDRAMDVLMEAADFDPDVVDANYINPVITMPIPTRLMGFPDQKITHPKIRTLDRQAIEEQMKLYELMVKYFEENNLDPRSGQPMRTRPRGFADLQRDIGRIRDRVLGDEGGMNYIATNYEDPMGTPGRGAGRPRRPQNLRLQYSKMRDHLLFRYLDFTVEPGNAYRYRVSLVLRNPNYERLLNEVAHPSVAEGEFRTTEPSEPTRPVIVPRDAEYYLTRITPPNAWSPAAAWMDVFQWYADAGTQIRGALKMEIGDFIGGRDKVKVVRPADQTLEEEDFKDAKKYPKPPFSTDDMLVDVARPAALAAADHPDLPDELRSSLRQADKVLIVNKSGELRILDPNSPNVRRAHEMAKASQEQLFENWQHLEIRQPAGGLDELMMMEEGGYYDEEMFEGGRRNRRNRRNPIRVMPGDDMGLPGGAGGAGGRRGRGRGY